MFARMRQSVATWRGRPTNASPPATVVAQRVAHIIEPDGGRELRVDHRHHVDPYAEGAHLGIDPGLRAPAWTPDSPISDCKVGLVWCAYLWLGLVSFGFFFFTPNR